MYLILSGVLAWIVLQASIRADCQYPPDPYNIKQIFVLHNGAILTKNCVKVMVINLFRMYDNRYDDMISGIYGI